MHHPDLVVQLEHDDRTAVFLHVGADDLPQRAVPAVDEPLIVLVEEVHAVGGMGLPVLAEGEAPRVLLIDPGRQALVAELRHHVGAGAEDAVHPVLADKFEEGAQIVLRMAPAGQVDVAGDILMDEPGKVGADQIAARLLRFDNAVLPLRLRQAEVVDLAAEEENRLAVDDKISVFYRYHVISPLLL